MPNPIRNTTFTQGNSLKINNMWIGFGDRAPSASTFFYNGITPPSSGYTIYQGKNSGGPSIYVANNDASLTSFTRHISGVSYTGATECLVYFRGQADKMVLNRDYEEIYGTALILAVDAGFTPSYPRSGTTLYDMSTKDANGIINGTTFTQSPGYFSFNGTSDFISGATNTASIGDFTVNVWVYLSSNTTAGAGIYSWSGSTGFGFLQMGGSPNYPFQFGNAIAPSAPALNTWYMVTGTRDSNGTEILYINGSQVSLSNGSTGFGSIYNIGRRVDGVYLNGRIGIVQVYSTVLNYLQISQNFEAQRTRFGI